MSEYLQRKNGLEKLGYGLLIWELSRTFYRRLLHQWDDYSSWETTTTD